MRNTGLEEAQAGIKIARRNINNPQGKYSILTHTYGIQKDGNDNPVCETAKRDTDVQNSLLDSVGEGEGGVI